MALQLEHGTSSLCNVTVALLHHMVARSLVDQIKSSRIGCVRASATVALTAGAEYILFVNAALRDTAYFFTYTLWSVAPLSAWSGSRVLVASNLSAMGREN